MKRALFLKRGVFQRKFSDKKTYILQHNHSIGRYEKVAFNLTVTGQELGNFLDAIKGPLPDFIMALGMAIAVIGLVVGIIYVIKKTVSKKF